MTQQGIAQSAGTPRAEVDIDADLVLRLLADQHPDLLRMPLTLLDSGWDNVMFRLGQDLCVRIPRRSLGADLIRNEQKWLPQLARLLPLRVPAPVRTGLPTDYYPWHWSVLPWIEGQSADEAPLASSQAAVLGKFLRSLHAEAPPGFPVNPYRGVPLTQRAAKTQERLERLAAHTGNKTGQLLKKWNAALSAPDDTAPRILHGDLHPQNILSRDALISGIIDWGDMCSGDVATDLACAWMLFREPEHRNDLFAAWGSVSAHTLCRAEGWAICFGTMLFDSGLVNNRRHEVLGRSILENVVGELI